MLAYLSGPARGSTISGQHNREPASEPTKWTEKVHDITGKYPGLWGADLSFHSRADRPLQIAEAKRQWSAGSLVTLMWHMCPPTRPERCGWDTADGVWAELDDAQWHELITEGTSLNRAWQSELDAVVPLLRELQAAGVEVLWRPLHEMNDSWAWWGGRPGPDGSRRLYQLMHDHLVRRQGLTNLVWVWNVADKQLDQIDSYYPGADYVDVASVDIWQKDYPSRSDYHAMLTVAAGKPIALGEVKKVPSPAVLQQQPDWAWFMVWAEDLVTSNSEDAVKATYYDRHVLNREHVRGELRPGS
ncbi:glycoside hydrolase family 26 protein [Micromonospora purpureochromogenes]|uniref:Mannan endo-1,4-beta-mannosidase n=1 Tax=Micromonospora purpureochromogenes TaxID=47872 RepID=A0ABX2RGF8_9ACTN|nr:glycosyl hydrolase [Micromonospora purpureochromogenes]NYF55043.1 mannan endo-1,4-beta-mannosidase [Micromonospora purpureochromogenes]